MSPAHHRRSWYSATSRTGCSRNPRTASRYSSSRTAAAGLSCQSSQHPHRSILGRPHPGSPSTGQNHGSHSTRWHEKPLRTSVDRTVRARSADGASDPLEDLHALSAMRSTRKDAKEHASDYIGIVPARTPVARILTFSAPGVCPVIEQGAATPREVFSIRPAGSRSEKLITRP